MSIEKVNGLDRLKDRALVLPARAQAFIIKDQDTFSKANEFLLGIKDLSKEIEASFNPRIKMAHDLHKSLVGEKNRFLEPVENAERIVKGSISKYLTEQEQIRFKIEQERAAKAIEQKQLYDEALRQAAEAEAKAAAAKTDATKAKYQEKSAEIIANVTDEIIGLGMEMPVAPPPIMADNLSSRDVWKYEIVDESKLPREFLMPDTSKIGKFVQKDKGLTPIPGLRIYSEKTIAVKSGLSARL
jgi:hypothetical protein